MQDLPPAPEHLAGYAPLEGFAAPARAKAEIWRLFAVLTLAMLLSDFAQNAIAAAIKASLGPLFGTMALVNMKYGVTPSGVVASLAMALPLGLVFLFALGLITGRGLASLVGPRRRLVPDFLRASLPLWALGLVLLPLSTQAPGVAPMQEPLRVLEWLPLALPGLILTAGVGEMIFRGFLQQQLAARWGASWVWMGLPSALFALSQGAPGGTGALASMALLYSVAFSAAAADLTARTGGLGAAIGLQVGVQVQGLFLLGLKGPMMGLALYVLDASGLQLAPWMAVDALTLLVGWLAARVLLRV